MVFRHVPIILVLCAMVSASKSDRLDSPELELQRALTQLENIENLLESSSKIIETKLIGPQTVSAENAFAYGQELFAQGHFLASTRQISNYLNLTQVPDAGMYLKAQSTLGKAYEQASLPAKALRAYMRYIAAFATAPTELRDYQELTSIMQRTLPLAARENKNANDELNRLFASVISMDMPNEKKAEIYYYAASHNVDTKLSDEWFTNAEKLSDDPAIDTRVNYFRALIALQNGDLSASETLLRRNLDLDDSAAHEFRDLSRLALARIAVRQGKADLALKHYETITSDSPSYKDVLFETMYLFLDRGDTETAKQKAELLAERFADSNEGFQAKTLLSYFALKAGDINEAKNSITTANQELEELDRWLSRAFTQKGRVTHQEVQALMDSTHTVVAQSETISEGYRIFCKLAEQKRRLADIRSEIRDLFFTLGRLNLNELHPAWVRRAELLGSLSEKTLEVGHRLMSSYTYLLSDQLSEVEKQALQASQERRFRLFTHAAQLARQKASWATWASSVSLIHDASSKVEKLQHLQADIASAKYLNQHSSSGDKTPHKDLSVLQQKVKQAEETLNRTIETIRRMQVLDLSQQGPYTSTQTLHRQYANLLHEEAAIITAHLDRMQAPSWRFVASDAQKAWKRWEYVSKVVFEKVVRLESNVSTELKQLVTKLDDFITTHDSLATQVAIIRDSLENTLGASLSSSLAHYQSEIINRQSRHQKWQADMDWIEAEHVDNENQALEKRKLLEEQILRDNLRDLRQGVFW